MGNPFEIELGLLDFNRPITHIIGFYESPWSIASCNLYTTTRIRYTSVGFYYPTLEIVEVSNRHIRP